MIRCYMLIGKTELVVHRVFNIVPKRNCCIFLRFVIKFGLRFVLFFGSAQSLVDTELCYSIVDVLARIVNA